MKFYIHYEGGDGGGQRGQPFCKSINTALLPDDATLADALLLFLHAAVARFGPDHPLGEPLKKLRDSGGDKAKTLLGIVDVCDADACFLDPSVHVSTFEEGQDLTVSINRRTKVDVVDSRKKKEEELAGLVHDIATSLGMHCGGEWADIRGAEEEDKGQSPRPQAQR